MERKTKTSSIEPQYVNSKRARQLLGVTNVTLCRWDKEGKIRTVRTPSNIRMYNLEDIQGILDFDPSNDTRKKVCYCRVSSKKQCNDLERQVNFFKQNYPNHTVVADVGSGINWKRKGLQTILELAMSKSISEVVVAHRDRLCRFAFELIEWILRQNSVELIVLDREDHKSSDGELTDDILSIIHVYSCREMGKRRYKNEEDKNISKSDSETDT